jgi:hypothetical protein
MNVIKMPLSILRFQYQLVRIPLQVIEDRVISRMNGEAPGRLIFERSLGVLDATVGNALGDPRLRRRGTALVERSDTLAKAATLDAKAASEQQRAEIDLQATREGAAEQMDEARRAKQRAIDETRVAADDRKRAISDAAQKRTAAARQQADVAATERKNRVEAANADEKRRIEADQKKATTAAKSKLESAQAQRNKADDKRSTADRVEQLADAEKRKRQSERADKS